MGHLKLMRSLALMAAGLVTTATPAAGQLAFGSTFARDDFFEGVSRGGYVDVALPVAGPLSVAATINSGFVDWDFGGTTVNGTRIYAGVGPRLVVGGELVHLFGHIMYGIIYAEASADDGPVTISADTSDYGELYGAGIDVMFSESWGVRGGFDFNGWTHFNLAAVWQW